MFLWAQREGARRGNEAPRTRLNSSENESGRLPEFRGARDSCAHIAPGLLLSLVGVVGPVVLARGREGGGQNRLKFVLARSKVRIFFGCARAARPLRGAGARAGAASCVYKRSITARSADSEIAWSTVDLEAYGLFLGVREHRPYIYGIQCKVLTDHRGHAYLLSAKHREGTRVWRWAMELQSYWLVIVWQEGKKMIVSDAFSRLVGPPPLPAGEGEGEATIEVKTVGCLQAHRQVQATCGRGGTTTSLWFIFYHGSDQALRVMLSNEGQLLGGVLHSDEGLEKGTKRLLEELSLNSQEHQAALQAFERWPTATTLATWTTLRLTRYVNLFIPIPLQKSALDMKVYQATVWKDVEVKLNQIFGDLRGIKAVQDALELDGVRLQNESKTVLALQDSYVRKRLAVIFVRHQLGPEIGASVLMLSNQGETFLPDCPEAVRNLGLTRRARLQQHFNEVFVEAAEPHLSRALQQGRLLRNSASRTDFFICRVSSQITALELPQLCEGQVHTRWVPLTRLLPGVTVSEARQLPSEITQLVGNSDDSWALLSLEAANVKNQLMAKGMLQVHELNHERKGVRWRYASFAAVLFFPTPRSKVKKAEVEILAIQDAEHADLPTIRVYPDGPALCATVDDINQAISRIRQLLEGEEEPLVAVDVEGDIGTSPLHIALIQIAARTEKESVEAIYVLDIHLCPQALGKGSLLRELLEDRSVLKVIHYVVNDARAFYHEHGIRLQGVLDSAVADSLLQGVHPYRARGLQTVLRAWLQDVGV